MHVQGPIHEESFDSVLFRVDSGQVMTYLFCCKKYPNLLMHALSDALLDLLEHKIVVFWVISFEEEDVVWCID